jgi:hypothetical protein
MIHVSNSKYLDFLKISNNKNIETEVIFILELLTLENIEFFVEYQNYQRSISRLSKKDGFNSFDATLNMFNKNNNYDIWIGYIYNEDNLDNIINNNINPRLIEMSTSVFASKNSPITTHMGISRNFEYVDNNKEHHKNISHLLHGFIAKVINQIYKTVKYMITNPVHAMRDILFNKLNYLAEEHSIKIEEIINIGDDNKRFLEKIQLKNINKNLDIISNLINLLDADISKNMAFDIYPIINALVSTDFKKKEVDSCIVIFWEHINNLAKLENMITFSSKNTIVKNINDIKKIENYDKRMLAEIKNTWRHLDWFYTMMIKDDSDILSYSDFIIIITNKNIEKYYLLYCINQELKRNLSETNKNSSMFIPELTKSSFFNNFTKETWTIIHNDNPHIFNKPDWFKHPDLLNHLPTVIINLKYLSMLFDNNILK